MAKEFMSHQASFRVASSQVQYPESLPQGQTFVVNPIIGDSLVNMDNITILCKFSSWADKDKLRIYTKLAGSPVEITSFFTKSEANPVVQYKLTANSFSVILISVNALNANQYVDIGFYGSNS